MLEASRGRTDELGGVEPQLHQLVGRIRWRLGREQLLVFALRGGIGAALLLVGLGLSAWLLDTPLAGWSWALASLAPLVAIGLAVARWPSPVQAARSADRHLGLAERLATAVELAGKRRTGRSGRLDGLQLQDG